MTNPDRAPEGYAYEIGELLVHKAAARLAEGEPGLPLPVLYVVARQCIESERARMTRVYGCRVLELALGRVHFRGIDDFGEGELERLPHLDAVQGVRRALEEQARAAARPSLVH